MIHFLPLAVRYDGTIAEAPHGFQLHVGPMNARSRGQCGCSRQILTKPEIRFNYLDNEADRQDWVDAVKSLEGSSSSPQERISGGELSPGPEVRSDEEILGGCAETVRLPCIRVEQQRWALTLYL